MNMREFISSSSIYLGLCSLHTSLKGEQSTASYHPFISLHEEKRFYILAPQLMMKMNCHHFVATRNLMSAKMIMVLWNAQNKNNASSNLTREARLLARLKIAYLYNFIILRMLLLILVSNINNSLIIVEISHKNIILSSNNI